MKTNYIYVQVRLDFNKGLTEDEISDVIEELDYSFTSKTEGVEIVETEIVGTQESLDYI